MADREDREVPQERVLRFAGASNFRDLGGHRTADGRRVRWRRVFRSDRLDDLDADDWTRLASLGIGAVIDFRGEHEARRATALASWPARHALPMPSPLRRRIEALCAGGETVDAARMRGLMQEEYRRLLLEHAGSVGAALRLVAEAETPVVFHCAAGKDRTGLVAALLLDALGVDRAAVEADYLLSNACYRRPAGLADAAPLAGLADEALDVMWTVHASHLDAAFAALDEVHGGAARYLETAAGVSSSVRARLQARLLEPG